MCQELTYHHTRSRKSRLLIHIRVLQLQKKYELNIHHDFTLQTTNVYITIPLRLWFLNKLE